MGVRYPLERKGHGLHCILYGVNPTLSAPKVFLRCLNGFFRSLHSVTKLRQPLANKLVSRPGVRLQPIDVLLDVNQTVAVIPNIHFHFPEPTIQLCNVRWS
jgi:hypothetical protein